MKKKILSMKKLIMGRVRRAFSSNSPKPDKQHRASTPPPSVKSLENVVTKR